MITTDHLFGFTILKVHHTKKVLKFGLRLSYQKNREHVRDLSLSNK